MELLKSIAATLQAGDDKKIVEEVTQAILTRSQPTADEVALAKGSFRG